MSNCIVMKMIPSLHREWLSPSLIIIVSGLVTVNKPDINGNTMYGKEPVSIQTPNNCMTLR